MLKHHIREHFLNKRKKYDTNVLSENISNIFLANFKPKFLHTFLPIQKFNEINTFQILNNLHNTTIIVPVLNKYCLAHKYYTQSTKLKNNSYGIPEPIDTLTFTDFHQIDYIIVPLVAYDSKGFRVGYGGGYYDKFLPKCINAIRIGLSYEEQPIEILDVNKYDVPLDYCITPTKLIKF